MKWNLGLLLIVVVACSGCFWGRSSSKKPDETSELTSGQQLAKELAEINKKLDKQVTQDDLFEVEKSTGKKVIKKALLPSSPSLMISAPVTKDLVASAAKSVSAKTSTDAVKNIGQSIDTELGNVDTQMKERQNQIHELNRQQAEDRDNKTKLERMKEASKSTSYVPPKKMPEAAQQKKDTPKKSAGALPSGVGSVVQRPDSNIQALQMQNQILYNMVWYQQAALNAQAQTCALNRGVYGSYAPQMVYYGAPR